MSIADQITRLNNAKANIKQAIENKGVAVKKDALLDEYPALIESIEGGGGNSIYEDLYNQRTNNGTDFLSLFEGSSAKVLDVSKINTSNVTTMMNMFSGCQYLESLDVSNFNTSKVWNMYQMFHQCKKLESLDLSNFNTSNVTNMGYMFYQCLNLKSINLSIFNTSKVTTMADMFEYCQSLTSLDVSNFDTSNVTNMGYMFYRCQSLISLNLSNFDMTKVTGMNNMFYYCDNLQELRLDNCNYDTISKIITSSGFPTKAIDGVTRTIYCKEENAAGLTPPTNWVFSYVTEEPEVPVEPPAGDIPLYERGEFYGNTELTEVRTMVTSEHDNLDSMFTGCNNLVSVNTQDWDTSNVYEMYSLFMNCLSLPSLNLISWVTDKVTRTGYMFFNCQSLTSLDLSSFNTGNVTSMDYMFGSCFALTSIIGLSNFNTSNVTAMNNMFAECNQLQSLDLSGWDTGNVTTMDSMFSYMQSYSLPKIDLSSFTTKKLQQAYYMFNWCNAIQELDIRNFELVHEDGTEAAISGMLEGCMSLHTLRLDNCSNATIRKIINESGMPQEPVYDYSISENVNRKMYCKASEIGDLVAPNGWEFVTVE